MTCMLPSQIIDRCRMGCQPGVKPRGFGASRMPWSVLGLAVGLAMTSWGADWESSKHRFNLNTHVGFNIEASFEKLGGVSGPNPGSDLRGTDHFYDDGYNRVDESGNAGGQTRFWGYDNPGQLLDDAIVMSSFSSSSSGSIRGVQDAPHWGAELTYARELGWNGSYWWGVEIGLSWTDLSFKERASFQGNATIVRDAYSLNGGVAPDAPYAGTFNGSGPALGDDPLRTVQNLNGAAQTMGEYELDASLYVLRLGLVYETPFTSWLSLQFGGGIAGGFVDSEFRYQESTTIASLRSSVTRGSESGDDFVGGAYAHAGLALHFHDHFMASLGMQYKYLTSYTQEAAGRRAEIDFEGALYVALGVGVTF